MYYFKSKFDDKYWQAWCLVHGLKNIEIRIRGCKIDRFAWRECENRRTSKNQEGWNISGVFSFMRDRGDETFKRRGKKGRVARIFFTLRNANLKIRVPRDSPNPRVERAVRIAGRLNLIEFIQSHECTCSLKSEQRNLLPFFSIFKTHFPSLRLR